MNRRRFVQTTLAASGLVALGTAAGSARAQKSGGGSKLVPPEDESIRVAFLVSNDATVIDFTGPWEVFQDVMIPQGGGRMRHPFELYTVADSTEIVRVTAGMRIAPNYSIDDAPVPRVIVIPAMRPSDRVIDWVKRTSPQTDITMSVCTGAFVLGRSGLLDGLAATTHHLFQDRFAEEFPKVETKRGLRFVENGRICTAGGLTSGIDLALRVVERYFGREQAQRTADYMEYQSDGWKV